MNTSSSICYRFDVEIQRGKFVEVLSVLKIECMWKLWHRFDVKTSMWIPLSNSMKYWWALHMDFFMSFRRRIDVTTVLVVSISFSAPGTYPKLIWYSAESMQIQLYWRNSWYWNYWNFILREFRKNASKYK